MLLQDVVGDDDISVVYIYNVVIKFNSYIK